jgi:hypothetical protein
VRTLGSLAGTPFAAVRDYLEGQALLRRGQYEAAYDRFDAAVRADSNFAVAWIGVSSTSGWLRRDARTDSAAQQVVRLRDRLPPATRAFMDAIIGTRAPVQLSMAETRRRVEAAVQMAPDNPEAWERLGESDSAGAVYEQILRPVRVPANQLALRGLVVPYAEARLRRFTRRGG